MSLVRSAPGNLETAGYFAMGAGQSGGKFSIFNGGVDALDFGTGGGGFAITEGANRYTVVTDADGQGDFGVTAATDTVAIAKAGYTFTPETRTVTGSQAGTLTQDLEMAANFIPTPPVDPDYGTIYGYFTNTATGRPVSGIQVTATLTPKGAAYAGGILVSNCEAGQYLMMGAGEGVMVLSGNAVDTDKDAAGWREKRGLPALPAPETNTLDSIGPDATARRRRRKGLR